MTVAANKKVATERNRGLRIDIIAKLYKHGYTYRQIRAEVMAALDLQTYSLETLKRDIDMLLTEWREERKFNMEQNLGAELARIDEIIKEAWEAWEKSKEDYEENRQKQHGVPQQSGEVLTAYVEKMIAQQRSCGDPRYLDIIDKQLKERRKLLGLYAPEQKEYKVMTFESALMETGIEENAEV